MAVTLRRYCLPGAVVGRMGKRRRNPWFNVLHKLMVIVTLIVPILSLLTGAQTPTRQITVDARKQTPISPYIYGINYPDSNFGDWLDDWDRHHDAFTLAREGGNRFTAYNWETNASNAGNDYFFENDDYLGKSNEPGWTVKEFLTHVQRTGAASLLTVPTLGYVSADKDNNRDGGKDVNNSKDYIHTRFHRSIARKPGGRFAYPPNLNDGVVYEDEFVHWVESVKSANTPVWFSLDNEPDFWHNTHLRIKPTAPTYAEIIANNIEYASAIKGVAPKSLVFGPVNYGWYGFRAFQGAPDANGRIFVDAYLAAMQSASEKAGKRLLDAYDFHWYPEAMGDGVRIVYNAAPDKPGTVTARIQAPRSLWDPTYVEQSWITNSNGKKPIRLLPDMLERVQKNYPGTKLSISEYDFGGRDKISGALAQADALGIFGRYGLFAACHWGLNYKEHAAMAGFQAFTNYDRAGSRFGNIGLEVYGESPSDNSVYASLDSNNPNRLTIVVINKTTLAQPMKISLKGFQPKSGRTFVVSDGVFDKPSNIEVRVTPASASMTAPPLSISTISLSR